MSAIIAAMGLSDDGLRAASSGCYDAARAAALSGVPQSTVYDWARKGVVVPTISPVREKLWSYTDLMALRIVAWLRRPKPGDDGTLPSSPMPRVRLALSQLPDYGVDLWNPVGAEWGHSPLLVDQRGAIFISTEDGTFDLNRNRQLPDTETFGLTGPLDMPGLRGPDLIRPRPTLRIVPAKVAGQPHVEHTRLTTPTLAALVDEGFGSFDVAEMYGLSEFAVWDAVDLEHQLAGIAA